MKVTIPERASAPQLAAIEDGVVADEEYTAGYRAYIACLREAGYEVDELGRPSTTFDYAIPDTAVQSGDDTRCHDTHFTMVDSYWQMENPAWGPEIPIFQGCLDEAGLSTEGDVNELQKRMIENDIDIRECLGLPPLPD